MLILVLFCSVGLLLIGLSVPLIRRKVPPNHWYGLRIPATLSDERVWYEANARTAKDMLRLGIALLMTGVLLAVLPLPRLARIAIWFVLVEGGVIGVAIRGWRYAVRLRDRYRGEG